MGLAVKPFPQASGGLLPGIIGTSVVITHPDNCGTLVYRDMKKA